MPTSKAIFAEFPNPVFIETGILYGDGVQAALDAGFKRIVSIDSSDELIRRAELKFSGVESVHFVCGDSAGVLSQLLPDILDPVTFWLDAHSHDGFGGVGQSAIMEELDVILRGGWPLPSGTVLLIDDWRMMCEHHWGDDLHMEVLESIAEGIRARGVAVTLSFRDGHPANVYPRDILVVKVN